MNIWKLFKENEFCNKLCFDLLFNINSQQSVKNCNIVSQSGIHLYYFLQRQGLLVVLPSSMLFSFGMHPYLISVSETAEFLILCQFTSATDLIAALAWTSCTSLEGDNSTAFLSLFTHSTKLSLNLNAFKLWNSVVSILCGIHNEP